MVNNLDIERMMGANKGPQVRKEKEDVPLYRGFDSVYLRELTSLQERLETLESISGISLRGHGISKTRLLSLQEEAMRRNLTPEAMTEEERDQWILALEHFNVGVVKFCMKHAELRSLPVWLMKLGFRLSKIVKSRKEQNRLLIAVRHLRYLLETFSPSYPLVRCLFHIPHTLSPIDGLILASQAV